MIQEIEKRTESHIEAMGRVKRANAKLCELNSLNSLNLMTVGKFDNNNYLVSIKFPHSEKIENEITELMVSNGFKQDCPAGENFYTILNFSIELW